MKKLALALVAATAALTTGSAVAADLPARTYSKAPAPVAVANWTGCYIGGGGGYGLWNQENTPYFDPPFAVVRTPGSPTQTDGGRGYFGTVQGGCDYQFGTGPWSFVAGAFADYDFASMKGDITLPVAVNGFPGVGTEKLSSQWSVGGRIGMLVTPQLLAYFVGGYTEAKFDQVNFAMFAGFPPVFTPAFNTYALSKTYKGWFIGAGDEYALSILPGLFWKTEYRFSQFDLETNPTYVATTNALSGYSYDSNKYVHTVRTELVYRFNWGGGAVVAKY